MSRVAEHIDIEAPPEVIYGVVTDVVHWARFSGECTGVTVRGPMPLRAGTVFLGHNRRDRLHRWTTRCVVTAAEPARRFAYRNGSAGMALSSWAFELVPAGPATTRVTHIWQDRRRLPMLLLSTAVTGVRHRPEHNRAAMADTLRRLKRYCEQSQEGAGS